MQLKKSCSVIFSAVLPLLLAAGIPLEWNINRRTEVPYEICIDTAKMARITGESKDSGYGITAVTAKGRKELAVTALAGNSKDKILLRFTVPAGTTALKCVPGKGKLQLTPASECENIFAGALTDPSKWVYGIGSARRIKKNPKFTLKVKDGGLFFDINYSNVSTARYTVDVPEGRAGKPVVLEFTLRSLSKMVWRNPIRVVQYDKMGKVLPVSVTDPRWISHMRPVSTVTRYSEPGLIHPEAKKIAFEITLASSPIERDNHGLPLKDKTANHPKLLLTELAMREAFELPFPAYRDEQFSAGVSGKNGDKSYFLDGKRLFFFAASGQGTWAEDQHPQKIESYYYPTGDGTIECFFKPESWEKDTLYTLMQATNRLNRGKGRYLPKRLELFGVQYDAKRSIITLFIKDFADKKFQKQVKADIPAGVWNHIAAQWSKDGGVQLYLNGKKIIDDKTFSYTPMPADTKFPITISAHQLTVGNTVAVSRGSGHNIKNNFNGCIDLLRVSSIARYSGNFTPEKSFAVDSDTRALFNFDRSFDGTTGGELKFISGSNFDVLGRRDTRITYNGSKVQYFPAEVIDEAHQDKVLFRLNYPEVPGKDDFKASYVRHSKSFSVANGSKVEINTDKDVRMDSIEYTNTSDQVLRHPIIIADGEIDPRSYGDIADTLNLSKTSHRDRANRIFNFVLGASDYFMNHQIDFNYGKNKPRSAEYLALVMLNSYCGFECGPLNNLAATLFACSGQLPSVQTAGFGHSFEQVFYDGGSRLYDLSAQKFFPSFDNESAASLCETGKEVGIYGRTGGSGDHFIRLSSRGHSVNDPEFMDKIGVTIKSGETFRIYFSNDGCYNDLQMSNVFRSKKLKDSEVYNDVLKVKSGNPILRIPRVFPHFATAFLLFNAAPSKHPAAFSNITAKSFCYSIESSYVIIGGDYDIRLADGSRAGLELSIDGGKTFRKLTPGKDGGYHPVYEVMARHALVFRINAPIAKVASFKAATKVMVNPRVLTAKLKKGSNKLTFKSTSGKAKVTLNYSTRSNPVTVTGVVSHGGIPGYERQFTVVEPGKEIALGISGVSSAVKVSATDGLTASIKNGKLLVKAPAGKKSFFGQVIIRDRNAEKRILVLTAPGVKLITADKAQVSGKAQIIEAEGQKCVMFTEVNDKAVFKCELPAGQYQIWNLNRFQSHITGNHGTGGHGKGRALHMKFDGKTYGIASTGNTCSDFYKAQFAKPGERSRFKWDFPLSYGTTYPYHRPDFVKTSGTDKIAVTCARAPRGGVEVAALLVIPECENTFLSELVKHLCGLNNEKWMINEENSRYFK